MKNILVAFLILLSLFANAQYSPSAAYNTSLSKPIGLTAQPDGARTYKRDVTSFIFRPYISVAEVNAWLTGGARQGHFYVMINSGGTLVNGIITGGTNQAYWYKDGIADVDLVPMISGGTVNLTTTYSATQVTITPPLGTPSVIDSVGPTAGIMTVNQWLLVKYAPRFFNIMRYGAVGDSATNCTTAFANAIAAAYAVGGGKVLVPAGFWRVDSIRLPAVYGAAAAISIEIVGEHSPLYFFGTVGTSPMSHKSSVIICNSTVAGSVILVDPSPGPDFSTINLSIKDLEIRTYSNSSIGGIDAYYAAFVPTFSNLFINTGVYNPAALQPTHTAAIGLRTPAVNNGALTNLDNITVTGYYAGIEDNEHTSGNNINVLSNWIGIDFKSGGHASHYTRLGSYRNHYGIAVSGTHYFTIDQMNIEHADSATQTDLTNKWQLTYADFYDPSNLGIGDISWNTVHGNVGNDHVFTKNGGTAVQTREIGTVAGGGLSGGTTGQLSVWTGSTTLGPTAFNTTGPSAAIGGAQLQSYNADNFIWGNNTYFDGTDYTAKTTGTSESINLAGGAMYFNANLSTTAAAHLGSNAITPLKLDNTGMAEIGNYPGTVNKVMTVGPAGITIAASALPPGTTADSVMVIDASTRKVKAVAQASIGSIGSSPVGGSKAIQYDSVGVLSGNVNAFAWDYANKRLGIGIASPTEFIHAISADASGASAIFKNTSANGYMNFSAQNNSGNGISFVPWGSTLTGITRFGVDIHDAVGILGARNATRSPLLFGTFGPDSLVIGTNNSPRLTISDAGVLQWNDLSGTGNRLPLISSTGIMTRSSYDPALLAPLVSPAFTSIPTTPTPTNYTNTIQVVNAEFTQQELMYRKYAASGDADYTVATQVYFVELTNPITSNRVLTLPSVASNVGRELKVFNRNVGSNTWSFAGAVTTPTGIAVTTMANGSWYILYCDGTNWILQNSGIVAYTSKTTTYSITSADYTIDCTGTFTVTLPTAASATGKEYLIKNSGTGTVTIATTSSQTIDGVTTKTLNVQYGGLKVQSNGSNYIIVGTF